MGACLCRGHKELHYPMTGLTAEGQPTCSNEGQMPSNGTLSDKSNQYDIGELATSSLIGLVATIKEHITKPTAMAQGRVAHLIEWKGWGGGGEAGGSAGWGKGGGGWGGMGAELQEDEQFYSQMTDEIKEARFAAGVAEQFALAEAAMNIWSLDDDSERPSTSRQAPQSLYLSHFLLDGGSVGVPHHLYNIHAQNYSDNVAATLVPASQAPSSSMQNSQLETNPPMENGLAANVDGVVRHVDSSSLSEDDVFYN
ncbi:protein FAM131C [Synchiropus picturatus]